MTINRAKFFATVRISVFGGAITQAQVDGCHAIITEWERRRISDLRYLAYMLATCFWETARTMQAIHERGPVSYFDKYNPGTRIGNALGNTEPGDGYRFRGRGYVQLTGRANYRRMSELLKADLEAIPDLALTYAAPIMFEGMIRGLFTGKKLSNYFGAGVTDWYNARRIINGVDKADTIAGIARKFHSALANAQEASPQPADTLPPAKTTAPAARPAVPVGIWASILAALKSIFTRKQG